MRYNSSINGTVFVVALTISCQIPITNNADITLTTNSNSVNYNFYLHNWYQYHQQLEDSSNC